VLKYNQLIRFGDKTELAGQAAKLIVETLAGAADPSINLTGGSTIGAVYQLLKTSEIDWPRLTVTWGDERFVPPGHPDHNGTAARRVLLDHVPVDSARVFPIDTTAASPEAAASQYESILRHLAPAGQPLFDLTLLSLGDDGHIASLLPQQPVLQEQNALVAVVPHGRPEVRITLTYPALARSRRLLLIASGAGKAQALRDILAGSEDYPASHLKVDGELILLADAAALGS
jgi:6-phosphogluconolactonase